KKVDRDCRLVGGRRRLLAFVPAGRVVASRTLACSSAAWALGVWLEPWAGGRLAIHGPGGPLPAAPARLRRRRRARRRLLGGWYGCRSLRKDPWGVGVGVEPAEDDHQGGEGAGRLLRHTGPRGRR